MWFSFGLSKKSKQKVLAKGLRLLAKLNSCLDQNFWVQLRPFAKTFDLAKLDLTQCLNSGLIDTYLRCGLVMRRLHETYLRCGLVMRRLHAVLMSLPIVLSCDSFSLISSTDAPNYKHQTLFGYFGTD